MNFEDALVIWFNNVRSNDACVSDDMLIEKARHYGGELNVTGFSPFVNKFDNPEFFKETKRSGLSGHNCSRGRVSVAL